MTTATRQHEFCPTRWVWLLLFPPWRGPKGEAVIYRFTTAPGRKAAGFFVPARNEALTGEHPAMATRTELQNLETIQCVAFNRTTLPCVTAAKAKA